LHSCFVSGEVLERGDDVLETDGFADCLCRTCFELDVDDVDMEMVVRGLVC